MSKFTAPSDFDYYDEPATRPEREDDPTVPCAWCGREFVPVTRSSHPMCPTCVKHHLDQIEQRLKESA